MNGQFGTTRDWIAVLSTVGAANMALGSLRQLGIIRHLPDPPIRGFDSNAVIVSRPAFVLGIPDAPVAFTGLVANIPLAFAGGPDRARTRPWIPLVVTAKAVAEASAAAWYLIQMRTQVRAWCAYCLLGASLSGAIAILASREALAVLDTPKARAAGVAGAALIATLTLGIMYLLDSRQRNHRQVPSIMRERQATP